jgi:hypothetical protein
MAGGLGHGPFFGNGQEGAQSQEIEFNHPYRSAPDHISIGA